MVLGRWWSGKRQESIFPFRQELHWQNLSDVTTWKSTEGLQLPGEELDSELQCILASFQLLA